MQKPVLAVDFDDVIAGFNQAFAIHHNERYGTNVTYDGIHTYDMALIYGTDDATMHHRVMEFSHHHHDMIEPLHDAIAHLRLLKKRYKLNLVTSRCESIADITADWKKQHAPELFCAAHFANGFATKHPERKRSKLEICEEINAVALIDDAVSHANPVSAGLGIPVFLPNRPWNQEEIWPGVQRFYDWEEVTKQLLS